MGYLVRTCGVTFRDWKLERERGLKGVWTVTCNRDTHVEIGRQTRTQAGRQAENDSIMHCEYCIMNWHYVVLSRTYNIQAIILQLQPMHCLCLLLVSLCICPSLTVCLSCLSASPLLSRTNDNREALWPNVLSGKPNVFSQANLLSCFSWHAIGTILNRIYLQITASYATQGHWESNV